MIRNVIFDWSGTLVDDLPAVWRATNYVFSQAQKEQMTLETFRAEFSLPFTNFYQQYLPDVSMSQLETWFHGHFREVQDTVVPLPHAEEFLKFCREQNMRTFLLSTVHADHFKVQAESSGFGPYLDRCYVGVIDKREMIHRILEENHLAAAETVFIGDMQHDIDTAHHGGIHSCAVLTGYNTLAQLRESKPDLIVEHLGELQRLLNANHLELKTTATDFSQHPIVTVGALIANAAGQVLLVRTHKWSNLWGIPGGKIKWNETSLAALRREILEETNLELDEIKFVMVQDCIQSTEFYREAHFVLLNYTGVCRGNPEVKLNEEAREFCWVEQEVALTMAINQPTRLLLEEVIRDGNNMGK